MKYGTLALHAPQLDEWTVQAINGIRIWQRNGGDAIVRCETLARIAAQRIRFLSEKISSDYVKVRTAAQILVYDAERE